MSFIFKTCTTAAGITIPGMYEVFPTLYQDKRGYFLETYRESDFYKAGINVRFVQDNQSSSSKGVLRGLHFQKVHPQGKLVRTIKGRVFDVAVDLRKSSPAFGQYYAVELDSEKQNMFYIPSGFAHGFYVLTETAEFVYKCTDFYHPEDEDGIAYNDQTIGIVWPNSEQRPILSDKDMQYPFFDPKKIYFE